MLSHFHLCGELRFPGIMGGATVRQDYAKMMMMIHQMAPPVQ